MGDINKEQTQKLVVEIASYPITETGYIARPLANGDVELCKLKLHVERTISAETMQIAQELAGGAKAPQEQAPPSSPDVMMIRRTSRKGLPPVWIRADEVSSVERSRAIPPFYPPTNGRGLKDAYGRHILRSGKLGPPSLPTNLPSVPAPHDPPQTPLDDFIEERRQTPETFPEEGQRQPGGVPGDNNSLELPAANRPSARSLHAREWAEPAVKVTRRRSAV